MSRRLVAVALLVALTGFAGCGQRGPAQPAEVPNPYEGPLLVEPADARNATERETGAAGRVVECVTRVSGAFRPEDRQDGRTPADGLELWFNHSGFGLPDRGYRQERQEAERALLTFRVDGRAKLAAILAHEADRGWHLESWAHCDTSEFPDSVLPDPGLEVWTDASGRRVPTYVVSSRPGPDHCDWGAMTFLDLNDDSYARKADRGQLGSFFAESYQAAVPLPADAVDTGYRRKGRQLWLSADRTRAYVGMPGKRVELWPRLIQPLACG